MASMFATLALAGALFGAAQSPVVVAAIESVEPPANDNGRRDARVEDAVEDAIVAFDAEITLLVALDGFDGAIPAVLEQIHREWESYTIGVSRVDLVDWLAEVDDEGDVALGDLVDAGIEPSGATDRALGMLSPDDLTALIGGGTIDIPPSVYATAREHLTLFDGGAPSPNPAAGPAAGGAGATNDLDATGSQGPPSPPGATTAHEDTADGLGEALAPQMPDVVTPDSGSPDAVTPDIAPPEVAAANDDPAGQVAADRSDGDSTATILAGLAAFLAVIAFVAWWAARRRHDSRWVPPTGTTVPTRSTAGADDEQFDILLDASRQMTNALDASAIARISLAKAMELAQARHGAFVAVDEGGGLSVGASTDGLLDGRSLDGGVLSRVAATGQSVARIAHDEPSITALPSAVLATPVIGTGRVVAVLFLVRPDSLPFSDVDEQSVSRLAPMVGSALGAASKHGHAAALSRTDALTGLANRRKLDEDLVVTLDATAPGRATGVVMIDVDHFKAFNDREGHAAGDDALRAVAEALRHAVRTQDGAYRYGGEEFALLLRDVDRAEAERIAERVRAAVAASDVPGGRRQPGGALTVSVGVALVGGHDNNESMRIADTIRIADAALYDAKERGRNCVRLVADPNLRAA